MTVRLNLDPNATQTPAATVYVAHFHGSVYLDRAGLVRAHRLDRVVTHGDGTWTAYLVRQTRQGRDYTHGGRLNVPGTALPRIVHDEIAAALDAAEEAASRGG